MNSSGQNSVSQRPHVDPMTQVTLPPQSNNMQKNSLITSHPSAALVNALPMDMSRLTTGDQVNNPQMNLLTNTTAATPTLTQVTTNQASLLAHIKRAQQQAGMNQANFTQALVAQGKVLEIYIDKRKEYAFDQSLHLIGLNEGLSQGLTSAPFSHNVTNTITSSSSLSNVIPQQNVNVVDSAKSNNLTTSSVPVPVLGSFCQAPVQSNLSIGGISNLVSMSPGLQQPLQSKQKSLLRKNRSSSGNIFESSSLETQVKYI